MLNMWNNRQSGGGGAGFNPFGFLVRAATLIFALIQLVLVARILLDLGVIPTDGTWSERIIFWSDGLAAPVQAVGSGIGGMFGGGELGMLPGTGFNPIMLTALAGWTVVEWLVMRSVKKFAAV